MTSATLYLGTYTASHIIAVPLGKFVSKTKWLGLAQIVAALCLVFTTGLRLGANKGVVDDLDPYGLYAFVITIFTIVLSVVAVSITKQAIGVNRHDLMKNERPDLGLEGQVGVIEGEVEKEKKGSFDRITLLIPIGVTLGLGLDYFYIRPRFNYEVSEGRAGLAITTELIILLVFVGLGLGLTGDVINNIKNVGLQILVVPLVVEVGTLVGVALYGVFLPISPRESLAIGTSFGWYSLEAEFLVDARMMTVGTISFMYNAMRELFSTIITPIVAKKIDFVEAAAAPGVAGMDVCLPIVIQSTSADIIVYSFVSSFIMSMSIPSVVSLFA